MFYEGAGCLECGGTGYKGRTAICELLDVSDTVRELILARRAGVAREDVAPRRMWKLAASIALIFGGLLSALVGARALGDRLETAASLNPLSAEPLVLEGSIAIKRGDADRARDALTRALDREPKNWYANMQLALLAASLGDYEEASAYVRRAQELNPEDPVVAIAVQLIRLEEPVDPGLMNQIYAEGGHRHTLKYVLNEYFGGRSFSG